jgi:hypothetical protein
MNVCAVLAPSAEKLSLNRVTANHIPTSNHGTTVRTGNDATGWSAAAQLAYMLDGSCSSMSWPIYRLRIFSIRCNARQQPRKYSNLSSSRGKPESVFRAILENATLLLYDRKHVRAMHGAPPAWAQ